MSHDRAWMTTGLEILRTHREECGDGSCGCGCGIPFSPPAHGRARRTPTPPRRPPGAGNAVEGLALPPPGLTPPQAPGRRPGSRAGTRVAPRGATPGGEGTTPGHSAWRLRGGHRPRVRASVPSGPRVQPRAARGGCAGSGSGATSALGDHAVRGRHVDLVRPPGVDRHRREVPEPPCQRPPGLTAIGALEEPVARDDVHEPGMVQGHRKPVHRLVGGETPHPPPPSETVGVALETSRRAGVEEDPAHARRDVHRRQDLHLASGPVIHADPLPAAIAAPVDADPVPRTAAWSLCGTVGSMATL